MEAIEILNKEMSDLVHDDCFALVTVSSKIGLQVLYTIKKYGDTVYQSELEYVTFKDKDFDILIKRKYGINNV